MVEVAEAVRVLSAPVLLDDPVTSGRLAVMTTSSPRADAEGLMRSYAVLTSWRAEPERVGMLVTFLNLRPVTVNLVYADPSFRLERLRTDRDERISAAVVVGRWLFATNQLEKHSEDRNEAGDRWARAVGGHLPRRETHTLPFDNEHWGAAFLACINASALPPFPTKQPSAR